MAYKTTDFLLDLIQLVELRWVGADQIWGLADKANVVDIEQKIAFFREVKKLIRLIPPEIFADEEQRQNMINASQHAQDRAIEEEEDMLDGLD
ncbi:TyeA family type III secretion system gatekeeper subunit [Shewanella sp. VB17]|uniref:TyeA family type III secretion system gatekeeper subunit n=1 Tax=Shewanella sp. VB17 TaxID=2739432 RepID=UPI001563A390|nr:TyeA family type III secretion system gatekeeper subunit [Shewanella sp. VB17]NRD71754.1 TyeA family type III secretion system gatekeeper subunit [Shewanella sp. VB17]